MSKHTVTSFDEDLDEIDGMIRDMGSVARSMVSSATRSLLDVDSALAQKVISDDLLLDARKREVGERAISLLARRQPMAADLRAVVGALQMATDLERIGDLAKNIAKRVGSISEGPTPRRLSHSIEAMAHLVLAQVDAVVERYVARNADALVMLRAEDEKIDIEYTAVFREFLTYMMEDPRNITACTHLLFCAKNLERIGDHVTNIAENAYYIVTGLQLPVDRPKLDETGVTATPT